MAHEAMRVMDIGCVVGVDPALGLSTVAFNTLKLAGEQPAQVVSTIAVRTSRLQAAKDGVPVIESDRFRAELNCWAHTPGEVQAKRFAWLEPLVQEIPVKVGSEQ